MQILQIKMQRKHVEMLTRQPGKSWLLKLHKKMPKRHAHWLKKEKRLRRRSEAWPEHKSIKPAPANYIQAHCLPSIHGKANPLTRLKKFFVKTSVYCLSP